ncbi:MAG: hypothetical protein ACRDE2_02355 [Chitinophagaceae bacterium]
MKKIFSVIIELFCFIPAIAQQGHGPIYGLSTPTLGKGQAGFDVAAMSMESQYQRSLMLRYLWSYGITQDLQINLSTPTLIDKIDKPPITRGNAMMPANGDIETSVYYRFWSNAFGVGKRIESTAILGGTLPTEKTRGGITVGNSIHTALTAGYASRTWYGWIGGGYQYYFKKKGDQLGNLLYATAVVGYRPPFFQHDYPKPDWRLFVESMAEFPGQNMKAGKKETDQRSEKYFAGPTLLGLYGAWGISGGVLFPIYQHVTDSFEKEGIRATLHFSYFF